MVKYVAAVLLSALAGKSAPSAEDLNAIFSSVGIEADSERVEALLKEIDGKDINEVVASGLSKLASVPSGGAVAASPAAGGAAAPAAEEAKEEAKKEESEEDEDMGFSLFD